MIVFYLNTSKGYAVLKHIIKNNLHHLITAIITYNDPNTQDDSCTKIKTLCASKKITCHDKSEIFNYHQQYKIAIGWQFLIQDENKLFVIHDSLLPKYRGFAPTVNALINGETNIGATLIKSSSEYDRGDIFKQVKTTIQYPIKINYALKRVELIYQELVFDFILSIQQNENIQTTPQEESEASYSLWRNEYDYFINWNWDAKKIQRFVDAVGYPYDGAKTILDNKILHITDVEVLADVKIENRQVGKQIFIQNNCPIVVCGSGLLKLTQVSNSSNEPFLFKNFRNHFLNLNNQQNHDPI